MKKIKIQKVTWLSFLIKTLLVLLGALTLITGFSQQIDTARFITVGVVLFSVGIFLFSRTNYILIDIQLRKIYLKKRFFFGLTKTKVFELDKIKSIRISTKTIESRQESASGTVIFPVTLTGIKNSTLLASKDPFFSRKIAKKIANEISVPLKNTVYGRSSTLNPEDLWEPLINRWLTKGIRFKPPRLPNNSHLIVTHQEESFKVMWETSSFVRKYLLIGLALCIGIAIVVFYFSEEVNWFVYGFFGIFILTLSWFTLMSSGKSGIKMSAKSVSQKLGMTPWRKGIPLSHIQELIIANDSINLVGDKAAIGIDWTKDENDNNYLKAVIPYELQRLSEKADHNV